MASQRAAKSVEKRSGKGRGRPTKYKSEFAHIAKVACEDGGFTDQKLAKLFNVDRVTIHRWKKDYPDFCNTIKEGKDKFDCEKVEKSFLKRATGYRYWEITQELMWIDDPKAVQPTIEEQIAGAKRKKIAKYVTTKKFRKEVPADAKAALDWLSNRNPKRWKKVKHVELTGAEGKNLINADVFKAILSAMPEQLAQLVKQKVIERLEHQQ